MMSGDFSKPICADYVVAVKRPDIIRRDRRGRLYIVDQGHETEYIEAFYTRKKQYMAITTDLHAAWRFTRAHAFEAAERAKGFNYLGEVHLVNDKGTWSFALSELERAG
jgi:hypothetical protein